MSAFTSRRISDAFMAAVLHSRLISEVISRLGRACLAAAGAECMLHVAVAVRFVCPLLVARG